jgi:dTDP-4-amino-4,6-dideoxy-D-galactose acyltransferase
MSLASAEPCELLAWDTKFFGRTIARVIGNELNERLANDVDRWAVEKSVDCCYFLARTDHPKTLQAAGLHAFLPVDIRVTLSRETKRETKCELPKAVEVRAFRATDLPVLQTLARVSHRETRFFADSRFPNDRVEDLYAAWIQRECEGRAATVLVAASDTDHPLGYVSCHFDASRGRGELGLVAVAGEARGKGVGKALVSEAVDWLAENGGAQVTVVTQGNNIAAQRLYQRCGFVTCAVQLWFHKWFLTSVPDGAISSTEFIP